MENQFNITSQQGNLMSLDFILLLIKKQFPHLIIRTITPYTFTIGSNNNGENLPLEEDLKSSMLFGNLQLCINPNDNPLATEKVQIRYRSYFNTKPYFKTITRQIEIENWLNEATVSTELFDKLTITQQSDAYDVYLTFIGFKIDYNG